MADGAHAYWERTHGAGVGAGAGAGDADAASTIIDRRPSAFARSVLDGVRARGGTLLEAGCGDGRDALFFGSHGVRVRAVDFAEAAVRPLVAYARVASRNGMDMRFARADFTALDDAEPMLRATGVRPEGGYATIYSRFALHAVPEAGARRFLAWAGRHLAPGGVLLIEVRSTRDPLYGRGAPDPDGDADAFVDGDGHYRRFWRLAALVDAVERDAGLRVRVAGCQRGWAPWRGADPPVLRVEAVRDAPS
jgi:SAM-dependent methyltransferase